MFASSSDPLEWGRITTSITVYTPKPGGAESSEELRPDSSSTSVVKAHDSRMTRNLETGSRCREASFDNHVESPSKRLVRTAQ